MVSSLENLLFILLKHTVFFLFFRDSNSSPNREADMGDFSLLIRSEIQDLSQGIDRVVDSACRIMSECTLQEAQRWWQTAKE